MSKIKFKLKSVCTTYVKDANGKLYKLNPGLNTLELNYDDYVSLATALGIRVKHKSDAMDKHTSNSSKISKSPVTESEQQSTFTDIVNDTVKGIVDSIDENSVDDVDENTVYKTSDSNTTDEVDTDTTDAADTDTNNEPMDDLDNLDNSDTIDYSSWSYNKLKSEYKKITGTNCRLKKGDVIAFLQEHNNV